MKNYYIQSYAVLIFIVIIFLFLCLKIFYIDGYNDGIEEGKKQIYTKLVCREYTCKDGTVISSPENLERITCEHIGKKTRQMRVYYCYKTYETKNN